MKNIRNKSDRRHVPHYWLDAARKLNEQADGLRVEAEEAHGKNAEAPEDHAQREEVAVGITRSLRSSSSSWLSGRIRP